VTRARLLVQQTVDQLAKQARIRLRAKRIKCAQPRITTEAGANSASHYDQPDLAPPCPSIGVYPPVPSWAKMT